MSTTGPTPTDTSSGLSVANRYGAPKRGLSGKAKKWMAIAALSVAVVIAVWMSISIQGSDDVSSTDVGFNLSDDQTVVVDFQVMKDPDATAECAVQALSENYAIVGWKVVTVGPNAEDEGAANGRTTAHRVELRTESPATTGGVNSCWIVD